MGALAVLEPRLLPVEPGGQVSAQLRVRNTGSVVDQFNLQVLGDAQAWATIAPPTLSLFPGAEETATVTFEPPRSSQVPAGHMPFGVRVFSKEDPQGSVVEEGALDIAPFSDVFAELVPRTSRGRGGATHDLAIDNRGNATLNATISAGDPDRLLNFEVVPPGIVADAGTASFAKVRVRPRRRFWRGPSQTRPFNVLVESPGVASVGVDGTMVQESILPPWFMRAVALVIGAIVALILLWVFLVKPAIQTTATEVGKDLLAQVGITPPPGGFQQPGGGGGGGGGGGATPSPATGGGGTPPPGATAPPAVVPGLGELIDGRIEAGGQPLNGTPGKVLLITDLVFSNPNDQAVGELRLERSGQLLMSLQLQNFRDLDFHFVTPLALNSGQSLAINCPGGCTGAAVYYSGYQR
jgi:hypothetical protein